MTAFGFVVQALESYIEKYYRKKSVIVGPTHVLGSLCLPVFFFPFNWHTFLLRLHDCSSHNEVWI